MSSRPVGKQDNFVHSGEEEWQQGKDPSAKRRGRWDDSSDLLIQKAYRLEQAGGGPGSGSGYRSAKAKTQGKKPTMQLGQANRGTKDLGERIQRVADGGDGWGRSGEETEVIAGQTGVAGSGGEGWVKNNAEEAWERRDAAEARGGEADCGTQKETNGTVLLPLQHKKIYR